MSKINIAKTLRTALQQVAPKTYTPLAIFYDKRKGGGGHRYKMWLTGGITPRQMFKLREVLEPLLPETIEYISNVNAPKRWRGGGTSVAVYTRPRPMTYSWDPHRGRYRSDY